jgi:hypothetical protein
MGDFFDYNCGIDGIPNSKSNCTTCISIIQVVWYVGIRIKWDVSFLGYTLGYIVIRMDVRILQISQIGTDFFEPQCFVSSKK